MKRRLFHITIAALLAGCLPTAGNSSSPGRPQGDPAMIPLFASKTLSIAIGAPPERVYAFVANPENLPQWAKGLGQKVRKAESGWLIETPQGTVQLRFAAPNDLGVLDHYVTVAPGVEVYVPMRVIANGDGSEILFTLFRLPEMSEEQFARDQQLVETDLRTLKARLEQ